LLVRRSAYDLCCQATVTVTGTNDAAVAHDDAANTTENASVTIDVLANDTDVDGHIIELHAVTSPVQVDGVDVGTAQIIGTAPNQQIEFTPNTAFDSLSAGDKSSVVIDYQIKDANDEISNGQATVTVTGTNDAAIAHDDAANTTEHASVTGAVPTICAVPTSTPST
jgi:VCBS repeat-containing protein